MGGYVADRIVVDTTVVIRVGIRSRDDATSWPTWGPCGAFLSRLRRRKDVAPIISTLLLVELGLGRGQPDEREEVKRLGRYVLDHPRNLRAPLSPRVQVRAVELGGAYSLRAADAMHLAVADLSAAKWLVTTDRRLLDVGDQVEGLSVVLPEDALTEPVQLELDDDLDEELERRLQEDEDRAPELQAARRRREEQTQQEKEAAALQLAAGLGWTPPAEG